MNSPVLRRAIATGEIRDLAGGLNALLRRIDCTFFNRKRLKFLATAPDSLMPADAVDEVERAVAAVVETVSAVPVGITLRELESEDER